jgi:chromosome segregation ATPase
MVAARLILGVALLSTADAAHTSEKAQMFPSLRKRMMQQHQQITRPADDDMSDDTGVAVAHEVPVANVAIPAPANVGADGFPELPAVTAMLGSASGTMRTINQEAKTLEAQVLQVEAQNEEKMQQQKAVFERKLHQQEARNREVIAENTAISHAIEELKEGNTELRKHAKTLSEENHLMRTELHTLQNKLGQANQFISDSMGATDDSKAKELAVLKGTAKRRHETAELEVAKASKKVEDDDDDKDDKDDDDDDDDDKADNKATSFMEMSSKTKKMFAETEDSMEDEEVPTTTQAPADPKSLVDTLHGEVETMQKEGKESERKLKAIFVATYQEGQKRHQALISQQKSLNATRSSLTELQEELKTADKHLEHTRTDLKQRLRGLGLFVQRLAHLALAPGREVSHLMDALPANVGPADLPEEK